LIIARAPFRISFVGGGSDLKAFYAKSPGAVISASINRYMYIMIHPYFHDKIRIKYSKLEDVKSIRDIKHPLVRECLTLLKIKKGIEIASIADVPAGTGVGSSSTFAVCLLHALHSFKWKSVSKESLAREACKIEIDILGAPIGKQDQYAASYGGLNHIRFREDDTVSVQPVYCRPDFRRKLERYLLMFYVGGERKAGRILTEQKRNMKTEQTHNSMKSMVLLVEEFKSALMDGKIERLGEILHEGWMLKKGMAPNISNPALDEYYEKALRAGAIGGKLLGAGSGGFLLFLCPPRFQPSLRKSLGLRELSFGFDSEGSKIIFREDQ
jgi:D-glycero-alpha-D-manno-heptose-7-phosphate kinase